MGNSLEGFGIQGKVVNCRLYQQQLGRDTIINFVENKHNEVYLTWDMEYTIDGSKCVGLFVISEGGHKEQLYVQFQESNNFPSLSVTIFKAKNQLFLSVDCDVFESAYKNKESWTVDESTGVVTHTTAYLFRHDTMKMNTKVLVVVERKSRNNAITEKPYVVTLAHYYFSNNDNAEFGLSMIVRIGINNNNNSRNGHLEFKVVEGPKQYPSHDLICMFDKVIKTGIWKPTIENYHSITSSKSDNGDLDGNGDNLQDSALRNNGTLAIFNSRALVGNHGVIRGNHNGNLIIINKLFFQNLNK